jgi:putative transposase
MPRDGCHRVAVPCDLSASA